jgi:hypothetical protein
LRKEKEKATGLRKELKTSSRSALLIAWGRLAFLALAELTRESRPPLGHELRPDGPDRRTPMDSQELLPVAVMRNVEPSPVNPPVPSVLCHQGDRWGDGTAGRARFNRNTAA